MDINLNHYLSRIIMLREMLNLQVNEYKISEGSEKKRVSEIIKYLCKENIQELRTVIHFLSDELFTIYGDGKQFIRTLSEFETEIIEAEKLVNERAELEECLENQQTQTDNQLSQQVTDLTAQIVSLKQQLQQVITEKDELQKQLAKQADKSYTPAEPMAKSGLEIKTENQNIIEITNKILAKLLKGLDYRHQLTKTHIATYIYPYTYEMALFLVDGDEKKAKELMVTQAVAFKHFKGVYFKRGSSKAKNRGKFKFDLSLLKYDLLFELSN